MCNNDFGRHYDSKDNSFSDKRALLVSIEPVEVRDAWGSDFSDAIVSHACLDKWRLLQVSFSYYELLKVHLFCITTTM